jgi:molybdopterin-guanine dinucleotide biosynthesis protein A
MTAPAERDDVNAWIRAGGKARRLGGVDKREIIVDGRQLPRGSLTVCDDRRSR